MAKLNEIARVFVDTHRGMRGYVFYQNPDSCTTLIRRTRDGVTVEVRDEEVLRCYQGRVMDEIFDAFNTYDLTFGPLPAGWWAE